MFSKHSFYTLFLIPCSLLLLFYGCAKVETTKVDTTSNTDTQSIATGDELEVNNEFDQAIDDAITILGNPSANIAGASVLTDSISYGLIDIIYSGKEADGTKTRSGSAAIQLNKAGNSPIPWNTPGAIATVTFGTVYSPGYETTYTKNNTTFFFTGKATLTNLNGALIQNLNSTDTAQERVRGSIKFTYNDNTATIVSFTWNFNNRRTFTKPDTLIYATTTADTVISGYKNIGTWGIARSGNNFYTSITSPIVQNISTATLSYNPLSGTKEINNITEPIQITYGVNQQGTVVTSGVPYGYIFTWINNGGQAQDVVAYYY